MKPAFIYILTNYSNSVLYIGVTSNLVTRIYQHKNKHYPQSFTSRYNVTKLVYYEQLETIETAIYREKQLKSKNRQAKNQLISEFNPQWTDLYETIL